MFYLYPIPSQVKVKTRKEAACPLTSYYTNKLIPADVNLIVDNMWQLQLPAATELDAESLSK